MKKICFLLALLLSFSCEEKKSQSTTESSSQEKGFSEDIEVTTHRKVNLLPEAREEVSQWLAYVTAQNEMENLRSSTGKEILDSANSIMQIMESLQTSVPQNLQTSAVMARTNVLLTKSKILNQLASKKEKDPSKVFEVTNELIVEFDNFKLQLNELFLKTPTDFEKELDEEFEKTQVSQDTLE